MCHDAYVKPVMASEPGLIWLPAKNKKRKPNTVKVVSYQGKHHIQRGSAHLEMLDLTFSVE